MLENSQRRRRIRIAMLVSHLEDDFDNAVVRGAMKAAEAYDVDLVILPGRYIDGVYADKIRTEYEYQYNTLFELAKDEGFDVLLALIGTIGSHLDKHRRTEFLKKFGDVPIITLTSQVEGYPCITVDNTTGLSQVIEHLIETHSCTRIGYMSGPLTNDDAAERMEVYKRVLAKHGIEYSEDRVAYGNFSKYVTEQAGELLDRCPDLEAIVCANDQMAIGVYQALEQRGLRPGKDVLVTGFDDDPCATELSPHLTTVAMDSTELGYNAIIEAVNYINEGSIVRDTLSSSMVIRGSCGCTNHTDLNAVALDADTNDINEFAEHISRFLFNKYRLSEQTRRYRELFTTLICCIGECREKILNGVGFDPYEMLDVLDEMADHSLFDYIDLESLYSCMEYIQGCFSQGLKTPEQQFLMNRIFVRLYRQTADLNSAICQEKLDDNNFLMWQTNSITRDMLIFDAYDDNAYLSVVDKLSRLHVKASYLYVYEPAVINMKTDVWHYPERMKLKAYHDKGEPVMLPADKQDISPRDLFTNEYFPKDRRYSMVVMPLFSNDEHYGLLIAELDHEYFYYLQSISVQLCAALRIITLMKHQSVIQKQLQQSLIEIRENNQLLGELSRQDELTGCFNRRGFFEAVRGLIRAEDNEGRNAVMIFADLDSLKIINDRFGHEEGDFAIRSIAKILSVAFTDNEVIGRIGGDEFVICTLSEEIRRAADIRAYIEEVTAQYNREYCSDKEYYIHASVGVYPFRCGNTVEISELLSHADALLYEQKKYKRSVLKAERDQ